MFIHLFIDWSISLSCIRFTIISSSHNWDIWFKLFLILNLSLTLSFKLTIRVSTSSIHLRMEWISHVYLRLMFSHRISSCTWSAFWGWAFWAINLFWFNNLFIQCYNEIYSCKHKMKDKFIVFICNVFRRCIFYSFE